MKVMTAENDHFQQATGNTRTADIIVSHGIYAQDNDWQKKKFVELSHLFFKNPLPTSHRRNVYMQFSIHYFYNFKSQVLRHPLSHDSFAPLQSKHRSCGKVLNEEEFLVTGSNLSRGTVLWHKLVVKTWKNVTMELNFSIHSVLKCLFSCVP